jgi:hypothetical protein
MLNTQHTSSSLSSRSYPIRQNERGVFLQPQRLADNLRAPKATVRFIGLLGRHAMGFAFLS